MWMRTVRNVAEYVTHNGDSEMVEVNVRTKCATGWRNTSEWIPLVERGQASSGNGGRGRLDTSQFL